jgi:hypothetical protein
VPQSNLYPAEGWCRRAESDSLAFHYFRRQTSLCRRAWRDPVGDYRPRIPADGIVCPTCVKLRLKEGV